MADRIPVVTPSIGVQDAGRFRPVLPEVGDAGAPFREMGRSLLRAAEQPMREKAEREALEAAGSAQIVKTGDGYQASEMPKGAGSVYASVYSRVVDERLLQLTTKDYEVRLADLQAEHQDDPQQFLAAARGAVEIRELQPAGRKRMTVVEWARGHALEPGRRLA